MTRILQLMIFGGGWKRSMNSSKRGTDPRAYDKSQILIVRQKLQTNDKEKYGKKRDVRANEPS